MAATRNKLLTPRRIARQAVIALHENLVMANLVHRDFENEFAQKIGDTVTIRKPGYFEARPFDSAVGVEVQAMEETSTDVKLDQHFDVTFEVGSKELTLDILDFDEQFLSPAMEAHAQGMDRALLKLRNDVSTVVGNVPAHVNGEDYKGYRGKYPHADSRVLIQAGAVLTGRNVPLTDRLVVTGPETAALWQAEDIWRSTERRGSTEGLTEAAFGARQASGFTPYLTQNIAPQLTAGKGTEMGLAFHKTAFTLVMRPLALPMGAQRAEIVNYKGLAVRVVYDYDHKFKKDLISLDVLYGTKAISPERAVLIGNPTFDPAAPLVGEDAA